MPGIDYITLIEVADKLKHNLLPENKYAVFSANRNVSKSENSDA